MADRARKLHVTILRTGRVRVQICRADQAERRAELLSSTDGIIAMETRKPGVARRAFWRIVETRELAAGDATTPSDVARIAFFGLAEPDVFAVHVVNVDGEEATFLRNVSSWLDAPHFPHELYRVTPERA